MLTATQHERIDRYLAELAGALSSRPEAERDDVVAGVREHVQTALAARPAVTDADVDEVLRALGDPLAIAAEATRDDGVSADPRVRDLDAGRRAMPRLSGDWVPSFVVVTLLAAPLLLIVVGMFGGLFLLPFVVLAGWAVLWVSPLWTPLEKLIGTFVLPTLGVLMFTGMFTTGVTEVCSGGVRADGTTYESCSYEGWLTPMVFWIIFAAVAATSIGTAVVLYRNGRRRAAELAQSFSTGA